MRMWSDGCGRSVGIRLPNPALITLRFDPRWMMAIAPGGPSCCFTTRFSASSTAASPNLLIFTAWAGVQATASTRPASAATARRRLIGLEVSGVALGVDLSLGVGELRLGVLELLLQLLDLLAVVLPLRLLDLRLEVGDGLCERVGGRLGGHAGVGHEHVEPDIGPAGGGRPEVLRRRRAAGA